MHWGVESLLNPSCSAEDSSAECCDSEQLGEGRLGTVERILVKCWGTVAGSKVAKALLRHVMKACDSRGLGCGSSKETRNGIASTKDIQRCKKWKNSIFMTRYRNAKTPCGVINTRELSFFAQNMFKSMLRFDCPCFHTRFFQCNNKWPKNLWNQNPPPWQSLLFWKQSNYSIFKKACKSTNQQTKKKKRCPKLSNIVWYSTCCYIKIIPPAIFSLVILTDHSGTWYSTLLVSTFCRISLALSQET